MRASRDRERGREGWRAGERQRRYAKKIFVDMKSREHADLLLGFGLSSCRRCPLSTLRGVVLDIRCVFDFCCRHLEWLSGFGVCVCNVCAGVGEHSRGAIGDDDQKKERLSHKVGFRERKGDEGK